MSKQDPSQKEKENRVTNPHDSDTGDATPDAPDHDNTEDDSAPVPAREEPDKPRDPLTDKDREWIKRKVAEIGPLTQEDREFLAMIFRNHRRR